MALKKTTRKLLKQSRLRKSAMQQIVQQPTSTQITTRKLRKKFAKSLKEERKRLGRKTVVGGTFRPRIG